MKRQVDYNKVILHPSVECRRMAAALCKSQKTPKGCDVKAKSAMPFWQTGSAGRRGGRVDFSSGKTIDSSFGRASLDRNFVGLPLEGRVETRPSQKRPESQLAIAFPASGILSAAGNDRRHSSGAMAPRARVDLNPCRGALYRGDKG